MDTSNEMETDVLQVSSTSDERPTSQVPSHALEVIQTSATASSESDSSPRVMAGKGPVEVSGVQALLHWVPGTLAHQARTLGTKPSL